MSADRNLLFGILALQLDFVTREQLIAGMQAWVLAKHRPLADVLVELSALSSSRRELLEPLVAEHIRQHGNDPQQSLAAVGSIGSLRHELTQIPDEQLAASIPHLVAGERADPDATVSVGQTTSGGVRFRVLRPHAQGGLGRVFVAQDQELNREVALKEIQPKCAHDEGARSRFVLEAEVTGGLEHPGIVPVYGLGAYPDGRPFYAMRFIKGDSLRVAIDRLHADTGSTGISPFGNPAKQLELRQFLGRFIDVCQAVGYAHSRGVLHRDLKPGNIMLGKYGETLVVDWGLAKAKGQQEQPATLVSEAAFTPASGSSVEPTQMGVMIGTLQYMSPEQASGRHDLLGPATDIFSLGATLYHLLTGQPPYHGIPREELEQAVRAGHFRSPRQIHREIPAPLEAICLKAMAPEPSQRYAGTQHLIADLEHYLGDEPVAALPEPAVVRARRWFRKRPAFTATLAVSLVMGLAALGIGSLLLGQKNQELAKTNSDLKTARDKAVQNEATAIAQKERADNNATRAENETVRANEQSRLAGEREQQARWSAYVPAMNVAFQSWQSGFAGRAQRILDEQIPPPEQPDLRGPEWYLLWRLCHQEAFTLRGHRKRVTAVEYSPDGKTLASASDDGTVILWNVADRTIRKQLTDHQAPVKAIAFSPSEPWMATAGNDGKVRFWDTADWRSIREMTTDMTSGGDLHPLSLAISPDGQRLVLAGGRRFQSYGSSFRVWNTSTWVELWAKDLTYAGIAISPDSQAIVVSEHSGRTRVYDLETGHELAVYQDYSFAIGFTPRGDQILSAYGRPGIYSRATGLFAAGTTTQADYRRDLAIAPSGATAIVSGGTAEHATLELWEVSRNQITHRFNGHVGPVWSVTIAPDESHFATGGEDATVRIWDGRWLADPVASGGHTGALFAACFSPDGSLAATGCSDKIVCLWNARTGELVRSLRQPDRVFDLAFSPDGKWLAIACSSPVGDGLRLLSIETNREEVVPVGIEPLSIAYSPDGSKLGCGSRSGQVILLDAATQSLVQSQQVHLAPIYALAFSHDGRLLATGSGDNSCRVVDAHSLASKQTLQGHTGAVRGVSFSVDDRRLATASVDASVKVWNLESGALAATLVQQPLPAYTYSYGLGFTTDGKSLVASYAMQYDSELRVFDAKTLARTATVSFPLSQAYSLGLSRDGQQAITGLAEGRGVISGLSDTSRSVALGKRPDCYSCAFSPDGSQAVIGGYPSASIVNVATRRVLRSWKAGTEPITSVMFVGGGRQVATLEADITKHNRHPGAVRIWDANTGAEVASHISDNQYGLAVLSPNGARLALASFAHQGYRPPLIEIWDTEGWQTAAKIPRPVNIGYGSLAFSPDGQTLAAGEASYFNDNPGSIWLFANGATTPFAELRGHSSSVTGLVFIDAGQTLVSSGNDQCLRVWDVRTGEMLRRLDVSEVATRSSGRAHVSALAATLRGDRIAALSHSGSLRIWETRSWQEVGSFAALDGSSSLAISPDGATLLVTSTFGTGPGYEFFEIASPAQVADYRAGDAQFAEHDLRERQDRLRGAAPNLKAVGDAHARGDVAAQDLNLANRLLRTDSAVLDATDREYLALIEAACRGEVPWTELSQRLAKVEPPEKRANREANVAIDGQKTRRTQRIADLLAEAKAHGSPDKAPQALDALTTLLRYDPAHAEARDLHAKIEAYHPRQKITNSLVMKLVELRPARYWMGSRLDEEGRNPDEVLHPVRLTRICYLGAHEVTRGQFAQFVEATGYVTDADRFAADKPESPTWRNAGFEQADDHPVVMVSWNDARAFCDWLSKQEGRKYRLPTEAEWELAARAGTITPYVWGQRADEGEGWGNLAGQELKGPVASVLFPWNDAATNTSPGGRFKPNAWGLYDMAGNVSEWCQDRYQSYSLAIEDDPLGSDLGTPPVIRGSSWSSEPSSSRSAFRHRAPAGTSTPQIGFRIVLEGH